MIRLPVLVLLATTAVLVAPTVADAAPATVITTHVNGTAALGAWGTTTSTLQTSTIVSPSISADHKSQSVVLDRTVDRFDAQGNFLGETDTTTQLASGFSFTIHADLATARLVATDVPITKCRYDSEFNLLGCVNETISVTVDWVGVGPISRSVSTFHQHTFGSTIEGLFRSANRSATVSGTFGTTILHPASGSGDLLKNGEEFITVCVANAC